MSNANTYYGWIPILGTRLYFDYAIEELEIHGGKLSEKDVKDCGIEYDKNYKYYRVYTYGDVKNKRFESIVSVDENNRVDNIYILDRKGKKLKAWARCEIDDKGLIKLEVLDGSKKDNETEITEIAWNFYRIVRGIYHRHTHHDDSKDGLLKVVRTEDKLDAIEHILSQFEKKIMHAHKELQDAMESSKRYDDAAKLIVQSRGEMIYALNFVNLFKKDIGQDKEKEYNFIFSNALQSLNVLADKIENKYNYELNYELNKMITILTFGILFLTFPIALDAIYKVLGIEINSIISAVLFFLLILIALVWFKFRK